MAPAALTALGTVQVPKRAVLTAAAAGCLPFLAAKAAVACTLGLGIRNLLERFNADFDFPAEPSTVALTMRQRHNAVNSLSAAACLLCFLLLV